jgi:hypothetical protein
MISALGGLSPAVSLDGLHPVEAKTRAAARLNSTTGRKMDWLRRLNAFMMDTSSSRNSREELPYHRAEGPVNNTNPGEKKFNSPD